MKVHALNVRIWVASLFLLTNMLPVTAQEEDEVVPIQEVEQTESAVPSVPLTAARPVHIAPPENRYNLPEGSEGEAWKLLMENKLDAARTKFEEILAALPSNLVALEGLRTIQIYFGNYRDSQVTNLKMVEAAHESPLSLVFAKRALQTLTFTACREQTIETFTKIVEMPTTCPCVKTTLKDILVTLQLRYDRTSEAAAALAGLGYIDRWQFVTGPFGRLDPNNPLERRFAPERALRSLDFRDEKGQAIKVREDVPVPFRRLNLETLFPEAKGIFYAFTNLVSDAEREVLLVVHTARGAQYYLRGLPVFKEAKEREFERSPAIIRTKLVAGDNPLLVKLSSATTLTVQLLASDHGALSGVSVKLLEKDKRSEHQVLPIKGYLFGKNVSGPLHDYFISKLPEQERAVENALLKVSNKSSLQVAEAVWLQLAAEHENDQRTREAVARNLVGSFPDAVAMLDLGASVLASVGAVARYAPTRHVEEARSLREKGLTLDANSHQHLLALYDFYRTRKLNEQAFELIRRCATAHPQSGLAHVELARAFLSKQFLVQAEQAFEAAALADEVYLTDLMHFHQNHGNRARARSLRADLEQKDRISSINRFNHLLSLGQYEHAEEILSRKEKDFPDRMDHWLGLRIEALVAKGELAGAYKLSEELYRRQPRNSVSLDRLISLALRLGDKVSARKYLTEYLQEFPGDFELRRRLREMDGMEGDAWWARYDIDVDSIDTSAFTQAKYPRSNHAWIVDFMVTRILPDLSRESYVHIAQKVLNLQGIDELSEVLIQAQRQQITYIRTLNPDGSSYMPRNVHDFNLAQTASLYKVEPGSILEHAYMEHADADPDEASFNMGFNFMAMDAPRAISRWVVMIHKDALNKLEIRKIRPELIEEKKLDGPDDFVVYQWTNTQVEGIKVEPFMPTEHDQEVIPLIYVLSKARQLRASRLIAESEQTFLPEAAIERVERLVDRFPDDETRFRAILEWVRLNIQPGNQSRNLDDVWHLKAGTVGQLSSLAYAMCRAAGLNVWEASVNGAYLPARVWHGKNDRYYWEPGLFSAYGSGGRMLFLDQPKDYDIWLQFTAHPASYYSLDMLLDSQPNALAMLRGPNGVRIKRVMDERLGSHTFHHTFTVHLDPRGHSVVNGELEIFGMLSGRFRGVLTDPRQAAQFKERLIGGFWPDMNLQNMKISNQEEMQKPLQISYIGAVKNLASEAGKKLALQPFRIPAGISRLMGPSDRVNDMLIKQEISELDSVAYYVAPQGHCWIDVPDDLFVCTEFGYYLVDYNVRGRELYCHRSYLLPQQRITPEQYPQFLAFLKRIAATESRSAAYTRMDFPGSAGLIREIRSSGYTDNGELDP